ncbi:hypothetical protein KGY58_00865 [Candidatus Bipolaricaulota bacterium]|nr:hypothetical protein [Candidatus Bipolaricaulota bacterium]MBS3825080.1 hypothetical protein [Candidatus Bipolaricaulota bacterium]
MGLLIGIDGGGTGTRGIVSDESGNILAETTSGPCNLNTLDIGDAAARLKEIICELCKAKSKNTSVKLVVVALAGAERKRKKNKLIELIEDKLPFTVTSRVEIIPDVQAALLGALGDDQGLVVNSGTGAIAVGQDYMGDIVRADGWGYLLGDEGSGYWIGLTAIKKVLEEKDGRGRETSLKRRVLDYYDICEVENVIPLIYEKDKPLLVKSIAGVAPLVFEEASAEDQVARTIVSRAGYHLGRTAKAVLDRMEYEGCPVKVVLTGGVLKSTKKKPLMDSFEAELSKADPDWTYVQQKYSPEVGSLLKAGKLSTGELFKPSWS